MNKLGTVHYQCSVLKVNTSGEFSDGRVKCGFSSARNPHFTHLNIHRSANLHHTAGCSRGDYYAIDFSLRETSGRVA